jgi:hypothetical protein
VFVEVLPVLLAVGLDALAGEGGGVEAVFVGNMPPPSSMGWTSGLLLVGATPGDELGLVVSILTWAAG